MHRFFLRGSEINTGLPWHYPVVVARGPGPASAGKTMWLSGTVVSRQSDLVLSFTKTSHTSTGTRPTQALYYSASFKILTCPKSTAQQSSSPLSARTVPAEIRATTTALLRPEHTQTQTESGLEPSSAPAYRKPITVCGKV